MVYLTRCMLQPRGEGFFELAVNGDSSNWSLCPDTAQVRVFYKPSSNIEGCYPVQLLIPDTTVA